MKDSRSKHLIPSIRTLLLQRFETIIICKLRKLLYADLSTNHPRLSLRSILNSEFCAPKHTSQNASGLVGGTSCMGDRCMYKIGIITAITKGRGCQPCRACFAQPEHAVAILLSRGRSQTLLYMGRRNLTSVIREFRAVGHIEPKVERRSRLQWLICAGSSALRAAAMLEYEPPTHGQGLNPRGCLDGRL